MTARIGVWLAGRRRAVLIAAALAFAVGGFVPQPAAAVVVYDSDTFGRSVTNGWGTADVGGNWSASGPAYSVASGSASIAADSSTPTNFLTAVAIQDVDVAAKITPPIMTSGYVDAGIAARYSSGNFYQSSVYYSSTNNFGNYTVELKRKPDNTNINPDFNTSIPGGSVFWLRMQLQGTNPTTIRWKIWSDGSTEPASWTGSGSDSTSALQSAGGAGVEAYSNTGTAAVAFSNFSAASIAAPLPAVSCSSPQIACDAFSRTISGGWGAADIGGAWNATGAAFAVTPGNAVIRADSSAPANFLSTVAVQDVDAEVKISPPAISNSYVDTALAVRYSAASGTFYQLSTYYALGSNGNNFTVELKREPDDTLINPNFNTAIPGGSAYWLRIQAQGTNPTTLRWKMWQDGTTEPSVWMATGSDGAAALQAPGGIGVKAYSSSGTAPVSFNGLTAGQMATSPPIASCPSGALVCDTFNRTLTAGWGTADIGGAWANAGASYSVSPGSGTIIADSSTPTNFLTSVSIGDTDAAAKITPPGASATYVDAGVGVRYNPVGGNFYQLSAYYALGNNGGNYTVELKRKPENVQINPDFNTNIPGGSAFWLRLQAQGTNPTILRWMIWQDGATEPSAWTGAASDGTSALQAAGGVGVEAFASGNAAAVGFNSLSASVIPSPPPPPPPPSAFSCIAGALACDTFSRTVSGGWGTADIGGAWSVVDSPASWSVAPRTGSVNAAPTAADRGYLGAVSVQDVDVLTKVVLPRSTQTNNEDAYVMGRFRGGSSPTYYRVGVVQGMGSPDVGIRAQRSDGTSIGGGDADSGIPAQDGVVVWLRVQLQGINPTSIRARVWLDGSSEPAAWMFDNTDNAAALQTAGAVGLRSRNEDSAATHTFGYQAYEAIALAPRGALPTGFATDTFNRTVSGGWGPADAGGIWSTTGSPYAVSPGRATMLANSLTVMNFLTATAVQDVDARAWTSPPAMTSSFTDGGVAVRYNATGGTFYQVSAYFSTGNNGGHYTVQLKRKPTNTLINPDFNTGIPGGTAIWLRLQAQGTNPTVLRWKIWQDGTPEPATWTGTGTDSTPAMQAPGGVGLESYTNAGTTTVAFNGFSAGRISGT